MLAVLNWGFKMQAGYAQFIHACVKLCICITVYIASVSIHSGILMLVHSDSECVQDQAQDHCVRNIKCRVSVNGVFGCCLCAFQLLCSVNLFNPL